jgi:hypothetical protein
MPPCLDTFKAEGWRHDERVRLLGRTLQAHRLRCSHIAQPANENEADLFALGISKQQNCCFQSQRARLESIEFSALGLPRHDIFVAFSSPGFGLGARGHPWIDWHTGWPVAGTAATEHSRQTSSLAIGTCVWSALSANFVRTVKHAATDICTRVMHGPSWLTNRQRPWDTKSRPELHMQALLFRSIATCDLQMFH